ncbi:hypothetical protein [Actinomyces sp. MRS3W]|uniref:hypothetical protein n=1 Tax=Actinomyces sp. MRS3W TaxID=2800796 RepID=UPI0028FD9EF1|nr:hypothetical protein [Actinomyces sp. MRS3W]MDU0349728.1 hypothetical protein [Actinomyces sp. MRS3W]
MNGPAPGPDRFERVLDRALDIPAARIQERVERMRRTYPWASTSELCELAASRLRREAGVSSGAVGACAALPAIGTGVAFALTVAQSAVFVTGAVTYVLTVAELQGVRIVDADRRRALVLSALLGREGADMVSGRPGLSTLFWAAQSLANLPLPTVRSINAELAQRVAKHAAFKGGALAMGRLIPFGIGAALGWSGGRTLAVQVIEGTYAALGPSEMGTTDIDGTLIVTAPETQAAPAQGASDTAADAKVVPRS